MDIFKVVASGYDAVSHALFLDVHMIGIEMDENIVGADLLDQPTACAAVLMRWFS